MPEEAVNLVEGMDLLKLTILSKPAFLSLVTSLKASAGRNCIHQPAPRCRLTTPLAIRSNPHATAGSCVIVLCQEPSGSFFH